ncbi:hypothetical protein I3J27_26515 [Bradyrhizobium xenonodulans]|uniref:Uncharacterized protein n=1 Tax=Bradyrhizobium xenonodulans TaxID=2736875 RepID=A0ABY7MG86_9BRAD|nr:hypothetical protein [Bradyrhizobium xenonodulans]WBL76563.1 hypothetical protein I3J27_26515 [Bradyrhizobium xenonodulans]
MFPNHHVFPKHFAGHPVIDFLADRFNLDAIRNRMSLPPTQRLATDLSASPHTGGHLGKYYKGFCEYLKEVQESPRYAAALAGDTRERDEIASDVNALVAAAKYALANGHLFANTPREMTLEKANAANEQWFGNWRKYAADNQTQIQQMQETIDQFSNAGQPDAALDFPLLSPTSVLSMAERIQLLNRFKKGGSPISLQFTPVGPVPGLPGLVPPFVDARLPGFIPPSLEGLNKPEGFTPSNPLLTYGLPGFPVPPSDWQGLMQVPPSVAMPPEPQVSQFHSEVGQPLTYLSDRSQVLGPQAPPDQGSALLMGAGVLGVGAMMAPGTQSLGAALLSGLATAALTRPAFSATSSSNNMVADSSVFFNGAAPYNPFAVSPPAQPLGNGWGNFLEQSGSPQSESRVLGSKTERALTFTDRFGNWTDTPTGTVPAQPANVDKVPDTPAPRAVAPEEARRLTRVNESNAGSVFTSGSAPVPYLPSTEFNERFGNWTVPTADGRPPQTSKPISIFADEPSYLVPPPIFGVDGPGSPRNDVEEWFSRWIRPLLRSE